MKRLLLAGLGLLALAALAGWVNRGAIKQWLYEDGHRNQWQQPERVVASLRLKAGDAVADLGAGGGYFTFRLAPAVGVQGKVFAVDVDPAMTRLIAAEAPRRGLSNIEVILAAPDDAHIPAGSVDVIFIANTYHHLPNHVEYFRNLMAALRPGGRIAIVEYRGSKWLPHWIRHATEEETIRAEMTSAGYRLSEKFVYLSHQHFLIFQKP